MKNYLAVWTWIGPAQQRHEITMSFWATDEKRARHIASLWFDNAMAWPTMNDDFTLTDLSAERIA